MENVLFQAHSGLRFLVFVAAFAAAAVLLWRGRGGHPYAGASRGSMAVFIAALDIQFLLGILLLLVRPFYGALMGHLVMMFLAVGAAHGISVYARKQGDAGRAHMVALAGVVVALLLIIGGIMAIRPSPFYMTPGAPAASTFTG